MKTLGKYKGCLIGGAAGDALGYAVEFNSLEEIKQTYGEKGITGYELVNGKALISDDTQMTMFTANGLLIGTTRRMFAGIMETYSTYIAYCYRQWYCIQTMEYPLTFLDIVLIAALLTFQRYSQEEHLEEHVFPTLQLIVYLNMKITLLRHL